MAPRVGGWLGQDESSEHCGIQAVTCTTRNKSEKRRAATDVRTLALPINLACKYLQLKRPWPSGRVTKTADEDDHD